MARSNGRWGRLRRVLNEDLSNSGIVTRPSEDSPGDTPRYGAGANIENHPQITDYIPRRLGKVGAMIAAGAVCGLLAEVVSHHAHQLGNFFPGDSPTEAAALVADRMVAWTSTVVLLLIAAGAHVVYLLKRHRIDDMRGRYRSWRIAGWLALLVSADTVVGLHALIGQALAQVTGWHLLPAGAGWWLIPSCFVGGYVLLCLTLNALECRTAGVAFILATCCYIIAGISVVGWTATSSVWTESINRTLPLAGHLFALLATLLTARYVVLDVQGLIDHPSQAPQESRSVSRSGGQIVPDSGESMEGEDEATVWIDGSDSSEEDPFDRPLSKAEHKRLRKQGRNWAA